MIDAPLVHSGVQHSHPPFLQTAPLYLEAGEEQAAGAGQSVAADVSKRVTQSTAAVTNQAGANSVRLKQHYYKYKIYRGAVSRDLLERAKIGPRVLSC